MNHEKMFIKESVLILILPLKYSNRHRLDKKNEESKVKENN